MALFFLLELNYTLRGGCTNKDNDETEISAGKPGLANLMLKMYSAGQALRLYFMVDLTAVSEER